MNRIQKILFSLLFLSCLSMFVPQRTYAQDGKSGFGNNFSQFSMFNSFKDPQLNSGYRMEIGAMFGMFLYSDNESAYSDDGLVCGLYASAGYQFNPNIYLGANIALGTGCGILCGADVKYYFTQTKVIPYLDAQAGFSLYNDASLYYAVGPGFRFSVLSGLAISVVWGRFSHGPLTLVNFSIEL